MLRSDFYECQPNIHQSQKQKKKQQAAKTLAIKKPHNALLYVFFTQNWCKRRQPHRRRKIKTK